MDLSTGPGPPPLFTVVLCTFDRAPLLPRALDSLLAQGEPSWEAVVVDDGSTDGTAELVRGYAGRDPRIRHLHHRRRGLPRSRNAGAAAARGRYATFLDSDDRYEPDHLAVRRRYLENDPGVDLLHGGYRVIGDPFVPDKDDPSRLVHLDDCAVGATFVLRPATLARLGGFPDVAYACDGMLFERAGRAGLRIARVTEPTYVYDRTTADSQCTVMAVEMDAERPERSE